MYLRRCYNKLLPRHFSSSRFYYSTEAVNLVDSSVEDNIEEPSKDYGVLHCSSTDHIAKNVPLKATNPPRSRNKNAPKETSSLKNGSHHDLQSFLSYSAKLGLNPDSTVYVGTRYEYTVQSSLSRLGFALSRTGGKDDYGIDLLGPWTIPVPSNSSHASRSIDLKVLIQCKALSRRGSPHQIRELEGAFAGAPHDYKQGGVLGLLVSQRPATKGMREALGRSGWPMGCVTCTAEGRIVQMLWNRRAEEEGLEGVGVGVRYAKDGEKEVLLLWQGEAVRMGK